MDDHITRLDYYAAAALQGLLANPGMAVFDGSICVSASNIEQIALTLAVNLMLLVDDTEDLCALATIVSVISKMDCSSHDYSFISEAVKSSFRENS